MQQQQRVVNQDQESLTVKLEEYTCFVQDTARMTDRRQMVSTTCITLNGILVGIFTFFLGNEGGVKGWWQIGLTLPIFVVAILVCWYWIALIKRYKLLLNFRFAQLEEMEQNLPGSHKMYTREHKELYADDRKRNRLNFSRIETWLPVILIIGYIALLLILVISRIVVPL